MKVFAPPDFDTKHLDAPAVSVYGLLVALGIAPDPYLKPLRPAEPIEVCTKTLNKNADRVR